MNNKIWLTKDFPYDFFIEVLKQEEGVYLFSIAAVYKETHEWAFINNLIGLSGELVDFIELEKDEDVDDLESKNWVIKESFLQDLITFLDKAFFGKRHYINLLMDLEEDKTSGWKEDFDSYFKELNTVGLDYWYEEEETNE